MATLIITRQLYLITCLQYVQSPDKEMVHTSFNRVGRVKTNFRAFTAPQGSCNTMDGGPSDSHLDRRAAM